jgi:hypothetical protein
MSATGEFIGILALYVDDALGGVSQALVEQCLRLVNDDILALKKLLRRNLTDFLLGLRVRMLRKTSGPLKGKFVIIFDGNDYLDSTEKMEIRGNDDSRRLGVEEITGFRSVVGSVGYMATSFLPGLSVEASMLGRFRLYPTVCCLFPTVGTLQSRLLLLF